MDIVRLKVRTLADELEHGGHANLAYWIEGFSVGFAGYPLDASASPAHDWAWAPEFRAGWRAGARAGRHIGA